MPFERHGRVIPFSRSLGGLQIGRRTTFDEGQVAIDPLEQEGSVRRNAESKLERRVRMKPNRVSAKRPSGEPDSAWNSRKPPGSIHADVVVDHRRPVAFHQPARSFSRSKTCMCMQLRVNESIRTTVEMKPEHRSALLSLASRRSQKGFSSVLSEAIENYLRGEQDREKKRRMIRSRAGSLTRAEANRLRRTMQQLRQSWR